MSVTRQTFRQNFPAFLDPIPYPDPTVDFWLGVAVLMMDPVRWGNLLDTGIQLFVAHNLALEVQANAAAANGGPPGLITGVISSKSVDKVSISYDTNAGIVKDAGHWNLTIYGTRLMYMIRMVGAGPVQIGVDGCGPLLSGPAWPGPWTGFYPTQNN